MDVSLFDAMELDNTQSRVASRRALALAHSRVENNLGRFLRAAQNEEEFFERLALVEEDFNGYVATASAEVGHEHPEHIEAALKDSYRLASHQAAKVEFDETPAEEQEDEQKEAALDPKAAKKALKRMAKAGRTWQVVAEGKQGSPLARRLAFPYQDPNEPESGPTEQSAFDAGFNNTPCKQCGHPLDSHGANFECPTDPGYSGAFDDLGWYDQPQGETFHSGPHPGSNRGNPNVHPGPTEYWGSNRTAVGPVGYGANDQGQYPVMPGDEAHHWGSTKVAMPPMQSQPQSPSAPPAPPVPNLMTGMPQDPSAQSVIQNPTPQQAKPGGAPWEQQPGQEVLQNPSPQQAKPGGAPWEQQINPDMMSFMGGSTDPSKQRDTSPDEVTCPECGGDGKTAGASKCGKCDGKGKVPNFGDSLLDAYFGSKTADGNTDLDGPEPKMDKRLWTPKSVGEPDTEDGPRHPTKRKDITDVIGPARNDSDPSEIHGQGTHFKSEDLPTEKGDEPFADNNMEMAPHTNTWHGEKGQTDPVTGESLEEKKSSADDVYAGNPLLEYLDAQWPNEQAILAAFKS